MNKEATMKKQTAFRRSVLAAAVMGIIAFSGPALAIEINEVEPNSGAFVVNALEVSQVLSEPGDLSVATQGATVYGRIGLSPTKIAPEVDVYSFYAEGGTIVTIHLEAPTGGLLSFDPILTLFTPKPSSERREVSFPTETKDAIIENYPLDITGSWQVIVSPHRLTFITGGALESGSSFTAGQNGDYKLVITPVTAPVTAPVTVQHINLAIKPGSGASAPLNLKSKGNIPVALLSSAEFDALKVIVESLTFGATGDENSRRSCGKGGEDVNGDGRLDLVCHFETQLADFTAGSSVGFLKGKVVDATGTERPIMGRGDLKVVPTTRSR
jgi:hypothetical protein